VNESDYGSLILKVFMVMKMSVVVVWVVIPCGLVDGYHCLGGMYHLHLQGEITFLWNIGDYLQDYMASQPRSPLLTGSVHWTHKIFHVHVLELLTVWLTLGQKHLLLWLLCVVEAGIQSNALLEKDGWWE
jgi:hypothetical protein